MQRIVLLRRPRLPRRVVAGARAEVAPEELEHGLALLDAGEAQGLLGAEGFDLGALELRVGVHVSRAHEEDVAEFDFCFLVRGDGEEVGDRDGGGLEGVVGFALLQAPLVVVEQDAAADDALLAPGADAVDVGSLLAVCAVDVVEGDAVVELGFFLVAEVAQAVPLGGRLRVEGPDVVVDDAGRFLVDFLVESLPAEEGEVALGV